MLGLGRQITTQAAEAPVRTWVRPSPRTYLAPDPPIHQAADAGRLIIPVQNSPVRAAEVTVEGEAAVQVGPYMLCVTTDVSTDADTLMGEAPRYSARLELDRDLRHVNVDGALPIDRLSPQEFQLLDILASAAPRTVSNQELADAVWGEGQWDSYMLHNLVRRVRRKLEAHGDPAGDLLVTVPGLGYRIA